MSGCQLATESADGWSSCLAVGGRSWVDPVVQYPQYAPFAFDNGMISHSQYARLNKTAAECVSAIQNQSYDDAEDICDGIVSTILEEAGNVNVYDIRAKCDYPPLCYDFKPETAFLTSASVVQALGTQGHEWSACNDEVHAKLLPVDWMTNLATVCEPPSVPGVCCRARCG